MSTGHPSLLYFGETEQRSFPLILVFGHEPNTSDPIIKTKGPYDFDEYSSRFWDETYEQVGLCVRTNAIILKEFCREKRVSPILFASPLPIGIENKVDDKWPIRAAVPPEACRSHINTVFSFDSLITHVEVIILSGIDRSEFSPSREAILQAAKKRGIKILTTLYFGNWRNPPVGCVFNGAERLVVGQVVKSIL